MPGLSLRGRPSMTVCVAASALLLGSAWALRVRRRTNRTAAGVDEGGATIKMALPLPVQRAVWHVQQMLLRRRLVETDLVDPSTVKLIGGVDISFVKVGIDSALRVHTYAPRSMLIRNTAPTAQPRPAHPTR